MIKNPIDEIAAREAEIWRASKAEGTNSDSNNNGKVLTYIKHTQSQ